MAANAPKTIAEYIRAAPREGQPHLRRVLAILKEVSPRAQRVIKWGMPFFVEPRFLFAFSAHKAHLGFTATVLALEPFRIVLEEYEVTKMGIVKIPYSVPLPEDLIRRIAEHQLQIVSEREDDSFW